MAISRAFQPQGRDMAVAISAISVKARTITDPHLRWVRRLSEIKAMEFELGILKTGGQSWSVFLSRVEEMTQITEEKKQYRPGLPINNIYGM